jgi:hypothetical protein
VAVPNNSTLKAYKWTGFKNKYMLSDAKAAQFIYDSGMQCDVS